MAHAPLASAQGRAGKFPVIAGILLGIGLGAFFDGIVLHQILQWHHLLSSSGWSAPVDQNLAFHTFWDGIFHALAWGITGLGLGFFWTAARQKHAPWPARLFVGTLLVGWGLFNVADGLINHLALNLHHVNETTPPDQWIWWDLGWLVWSAAMLAAGWLIVRSGQRISSAGTTSISHVVE